MNCREVLLSRHRHGFTLLELLAVLLLTGLLASVAVASFRAARRIANLQQATGGLTALDAAARREAASLGRPVQLLFNLDEQVVQAIDVGMELHRVIDQVTLNGSLRIERIVTPDQSLSAGQIALPCTPASSSHAALTPSYALRIVDDPGPGSIQKEQWILVAGLTGQITTPIDENTVTQIFNPRK
ncbi:MAG: prepilin-type N-terminal cleavage/methylation domain-containing protein [Phycisphaeraceae bacterium]|nr:prepilin-type N-terminal cleavage/methylation domain-containing protein [Phycisphaeraceae bacterium]